MASTTKRKIHQYSEAALEEALHEIRQGLSTIRAASRKFGVPRGTLQDRIHGRVSEGPRKMGPDAVLTLAEEKKLVQWIKDLVKCGFERKVEDLLNTVQKIIIDDGRKNPFKNGRPGKKWYASFLRRNPGLEHRVSQGVSKGRAIVTEEAIKKWFKELEDFLKNMTILIYLNIQAGYLMEMKLRLACVPKLASRNFRKRHSPDNNSFNHTLPNVPPIEFHIPRCSNTGWCVRDRSRSIHPCKRTFSFPLDGSAVETSSCDSSNSTQSSERNPRVSRKRCPYEILAYEFSDARHAAMLA
ncbi:hypothetical protein JTE90_008413 [Oedothorax gibbosus]|uniref:HTH psq-type domain-containing protein n=1 Tax=Oedothorax gibbosus TaxID=931172 RepID=A0AAV6V607_9ARAC|nr:hypothetical protein JTE90_008413 [Oedothorax gibbosus]